MCVLRSLSLHLLLFSHRRPRPRVRPPHGDRGVGFLFPGHPRPAPAAKRGRARPVQWATSRLFWRPIGDRTADGRAEVKSEEREARPRRSRRRPNVQIWLSDCNFVNSFCTKNPHTRFHSLRKKMPIKTSLKLYLVIKWVKFCIHNCKFRCKAMVAIIIKLTRLITNELMTLTKVSSLRA